jgi:hypothetical protein
VGGGRGVRGGRRGGGGADTLPAKARAAPLTAAHARAARSPEAGRQDPRAGGAKGQLPGRAAPGLAGPPRPGDSGRALGAALARPPLRGQPRGVRCPRPTLPGGSPRLPGFSDLKSVSSSLGYCCREKSK